MERLNEIKRRLINLEITADDIDWLIARLEAAVKVVEAARHCKNIYDVVDFKYTAFDQVIEALEAFDEGDR